ncbi:PTS lactose/cellobiose transporter subunit IIA, partial [Brachyspira pulli]|uniref:PTS lactose/cellobiose transporter subunit IIA n=1 Tax=Brachyspira pulli TaxID=310721 RepID=UPI003005A8DF
GKVFAYEVLRLAKEKKFEEAAEKIKEADEIMLKSHEFQTNLITREADGEKIEITMLFVHAQDHLMTAMSEKNLIKEMISLLEMNHNK